MGNVVCIPILVNIEMKNRNGIDIRVGFAASKGKLSLHQKNIKVFFV